MAISCPIPASNGSCVTLAHGGGGTLMEQLIQNGFRSVFDNDLLNQQSDATVFHIGSQTLAFTTDSFVVNPLFFPGGDIGKLAVYGTVNDLAMSGARPLYLSCGMILEEGYPLHNLQRIVRSMKSAADTAGIQIITGDTKVVDHGKADGVFINTSGIGVISNSTSVSPVNVKEGDAIILSGDIGRHGIAIMAAREGIEFETQLESDCAPLNWIVQKLLDEHTAIHCMRDLTRGGLTAALNEISHTAMRSFHVIESQIPVSDEVRGACEMLGLDPLSVANEGRFILFVSQEMKEKTLTILHQFSDAQNAAEIGIVTSDKKPLVTIQSLIGVNRILDRPSGEQLPRIC